MLRTITALIQLLDVDVKATGQNLVDVCRPIDNKSFNKIASMVLPNTMNKNINPVGAIKMYIKNRLVPALSKCNNNIPTIKCKDNNDAFINAFFIGIITEASTTNLLDLLEAINHNSDVKMADRRLDCVSACCVLLELVDKRAIPTANIENDIGMSLNEFINYFFEAQCILCGEDVFKKSLNIINGVKKIIAVKNKLCEFITASSTGGNHPTGDDEIRLIQTMTRLKQSIKTEFNSLVNLDEYPKLDGTNDEIKQERYLNFYNLLELVKNGMLGTLEHSSLNLGNVADMLEHLRSSLDCLKIVANRAILFAVPNNMIDNFVSVFKGKGNGSFPFSVFGADEKFRSVNHHDFINNPPGSTTSSSNGISNDPWYKSTGFIIGMMTFAVVMILIGVSVYYLKNKKNILQ